MTSSGQSLTLFVRHDTVPPTEIVQEAAMPVNRGEFLHLIAGGVTASFLVSSTLARAASGPKIKAVAFDAFPIFDPRPIMALADELFPGQGTDLSNAWRTRQFEYTWLRTLSRHY